MLTFAGKNIEIRQHFNRSLRKLQSFFLYRRLLTTPDTLFVSTAGRSDLMLIDLAANATIPPNKVYLYFHWFRPTAKKIATLKKIALKQPNLHIIGPTPSVVKIFTDAGFLRAEVVSYPVAERQESVGATPTTFTHLLFAGAARQDKGFSHVVDLVAYLQERGMQLPVIMQTSPEHYGKYDVQTKKDIQRLRDINYAHLSFSPDTLDRTAYMALFSGAICLQLYDAEDFTDRVSGVTLDAFSAGCPIVATTGTWIARMAQRFDSGLVLSDPSPSNILNAIERIVADYVHYNAQAITAGGILRIENAAGSLFRAITQ